MKKLIFFTILFLSGCYTQFRPIPTTNPDIQIDFDYTHRVSVQRCTRLYNPIIDDCKLCHRQQYLYIKWHHPLYRFEYERYYVERNRIYLKKDVEKSKLNYKTEKIEKVEKLQERQERQPSQDVKKTEKTERTERSGKTR